MYGPKKYLNMEDFRKVTLKIKFMLHQIKAQQFYSNFFKKILRIILHLLSLAIRGNNLRHSTDVANSWIAAIFE